MFSVFLYSFNAIFPLIAVIFLGALLKKKGIFTDEFLRVANRFVFNIIMPVLIGKNIYDIETFTDFRWDIAVFSAFMMVVLFGFGVVISMLFFKNAEQRGVITQCTFRANYIILGLPLVSKLVGSDNISSAAIISALAVPTVNILSVIALSMYSKDKNKKSVRQLVSEIMHNPIIIGAVIGLLCLAVRCFIPQNADGEPVFSIKGSLTFFYSLAELIAESGTFLPLIVLGGMLDIRSVRSRIKAISIGVAARTIAAPIIGFGFVFLAVHFGFISCGETEYAAFIALFGAPVAVSSAIMSEEMGADGELARQLVVWTSLVSGFTLFALVALAKHLALI